MTYEPTAWDAGSAFLDALFTSAPIGLAFVDRELRYVRISEGLAAMNGLSAEAHRGLAVRDVVPDLWPTIGPHLARVVETGEPLVDVALSGPRAGGQVQHSLVSYHPVRAPDGSTAGVAVVVIDVTARHRAEREREAAATRLHAAYEITAPAASHLDLDALLHALIARLAAALETDTANVLLVTDDGGTLAVRASHGMDEEVRRDLRIPLGRGIAGRIAATRRALIVDDVSRAEEVWSDVLRAQVRSLMGVPLLVEGELLGVLDVGSATPRRFTSGDLDLLQLVADRIAVTIQHARLYEAERQARADAELANRTKDEFLATVSHELRAPLSPIFTYARLLRTQRLPPRRAEHALETIERNSIALAQLINDLLDVSRIISGKLRLDVRRVDLAGVVGDALEAVRPAATAKQIRLETWIAPDVTPVAGDASRLQQVVWNLLSNAVKFTPEGGRVEVRVTRAGRRVVIAVSDTGKGIPPQFLPYLFDRFRQADTGSTRAYGGLGLGLAIVRHLVELHGGTVEAESAGTGLGSTFTVTLPGDDGPARGAEAEVDRSFDCPPSLKGMRILVVDDEADAREMLTEVFVTCDADVMVAESAAEAFELLLSWRPHVLVSDVAMPGEDGYALIRKVRELPAERGGRTPAVALTGYSRAVDRTDALRAGFEAHVPKPVEPGELVAIVANVSAWSASDAGTSNDA